MPRSLCKPYFGLFFALFFALSSGNCAGRQVRSELEIDEAAQRAAANEESGWRALESTIRTKDEDPDVEMQRKALAAAGKIQSPRTEALARENLTNKYMRGEAAAALISQRNAANKDQIDAALVEAARSNAQEFSGLTRDEIKALGETDNPEAVKLLKQQMGRDPNKDELTIDSLGKILKRRSRSSVSPVDFSLPLGQAPATVTDPVPVAATEAPSAPKLSTETIMSSEGKGSTPAATEEPASADDTDPEKVLLNYLATDANADAKDRAVQNIADAHEKGTAYLITLAGKKSLGIKTRIAIIDFLTRLAVNTQDKSMIQTFYTLRRRAGNVQLAASIDLSLRILGSAFGRGVSAGTVRVARRVTGDGYDPLAKEADIVSLSERPYPGYSAADVKTNLKKALVYYRLDAKLADRMERRVTDLLNLPQNKQSPERNLIFVALGRLYPAQDFYVLKKQGQDAFAKPGYFTTTLRLVTASARGRSWQIAALQRLWGLTPGEADKIRQIYLRDGKILQQRMRL